MQSLAPSPWPLVAEEAEDPGLGDTFRGSGPDFPSVTRTRASVGGREPEHDEDPRHTRPAAALGRARPGNHHISHHTTGAHVAVLAMGRKGGYNKENLEIFRKISSREVNLAQKIILMTFTLSILFP